MLGLAEPRYASEAISSAPPATVMPPRKELLLAGSVSVPGPVFTKRPGPVIVELSVRLVVGLLTSKLESPAMKKDLLMLLVGPLYWRVPLFSVTPLAAREVS